MLDLAISDDIDGRGKTIVLTNHGQKLRASRWPQDCEFQLVAFPPSARTCQIIWTEELAEDIGMAIRKLDEAGALPSRKPGWYRRLARYARGARST